MITPEAAIGGSVQAKYIIWGLWLGLNEMIERETFETAVFTLKWNRQAVGYITFGRPEASLDLDGVNRSEILNRRSTSIPQTTGQSLGNSTTLSAQRLIATFNRIEPPLLAINVLMAIIYGLAFLAHYPKEYHLDKVELSLSGPFYISLGIVDPGAGRRTESIFLEPRWIITTLSQIPQFMMQDGRWTGVEVRINVNEELVGHGVINKSGALPSFEVVGRPETA